MNAESSRQKQSRAEKWTPDFAGSGLISLEEEPIFLLEMTGKREKKSSGATSE